MPLKPCPNTTQCLKVMEIYREIYMHYLVVEPTYGMHLIWKLFCLRRELYSARVRACIYLNEGSYCQCHFVNIYETQKTKPNVLYRAKTIHKNEKRKKGENKKKRDKFAKFGETKWWKLERRKAEREHNRVSFVGERDFLRSAPTSDKVTSVAPRTVEHSVVR